MPLREAQHTGGRVRRWFLLSGSLVAVAPFAALAETPSVERADEPEIQMEDLRAMSLEELLNTNVTVATRTKSTAREAPGIVTILTKEEIRAFGARDFVDVLRMVPGFDVNMDGWNVMGVAMRGLQANEGRVLLLWDGVNMNEGTAGNLPLGNRLPVDQIERVEIIRGPGTVMYGGTAAVAVIAVTSIQAAHTVHGVGGGLSYGEGTHDFLHQHFHGVAGGSWKMLKGSAGLFLGNGQRTDQDTFFSTTGEQLNHKGNWDLKPLLLNAHGSVGNLSAQLLYDGYTNSDGFFFGGGNLTTPMHHRFSTFDVELKYDQKLGERLTLTPYFSHRVQKSWWTDDEPNPGLVNMVITRSRLGAIANWNPWSFANLLGGVEVMRDNARNGAFSPPFPDGTNEVSYYNVATYLEAQYKGPVIATAGVRYEHHSAYGSFAVPRVGVTKALGAWHFKLLYAHAFRAPQITNILLGVDPSQIRPERTRTAELEVGRQIGPGLLSVNLFHTLIDRPLIYLGALDRYENQSQTGSWGLEAEYKARWSWGFLNSNLSFYTFNNKAAFYEVPGHKDYALAQPRLKGSVSVGWRVTPKITLGPSVLVLGKRIALDWIPERGIADYRFFDPAWLLNMMAEYHDGPWAVSVSVSDILNQKPGYLQQYQAFTAPEVPGPSREVMARFRYGF